ncbi:hypothetical protein VP01_2540g5 [Puccinia sorghi]|uniref:Uncharacterized protein n=1 Tax=Puccinia sorghi TaxID=27349 RepID=A0A0L6V5X5_9BASI|nr:hypothetical protein VP01_2540g5 [Puccinia sorghi]
MFTFARLRLALLLGEPLFLPYPRGIGLQFFPSLVGLYRNAESRAVIRSDQKDISDNSQPGDQTFEYSYEYPETAAVKSVCTSGHEAIKFAGCLDLLAIPFSSRAPSTGGPKNLLTGKDLKPDFGFVNNKNINGQLRKVTYGVDELGNIVANSAHFYGWIIVSKQEAAATTIETGKPFMLG